MANVVIRLIMTTAVVVMHVKPHCVTAAFLLVRVAQITAAVNAYSPAITAMIDIVPVASNL